MRNIKSRVCLLSLVLLASPASIWAKEGEGVTLREPMESKSAGQQRLEKVREVVTESGAKFVFKQVVGRITGELLWPTKLGDATLSPSQRAALEPPAPSAGVASESKPTAKASPASLTQPASELASRTIVDRGDNQKGGDKGRTGGDGGRVSNPRGDAGLGTGPSHEGRY